MLILIRILKRGIAALTLVLHVMDQYYFSKFRIDVGGIVSSEVTLCMCFIFTN